MTVDTGPAGTLEPSLACLGLNCKANQQPYIVQYGMHTLSNDHPDTKLECSQGPFHKAV